MQRSTPPVLWVNHNAKNRKALSYQHAVFTHVQRFRKWKRKQGAQALQKSALFPTLNFVEVREVAAEDKSVGNGVFHEETIETRPHSATERRKEPLENHIEVDIAQAKPLTILRKGNSDPLRAFAISIDAKVTHVMAYMEELYLPEQDDSEQKRTGPHWPQNTCLTTTVDSSLDYCAPSVRSYLDSCRLDPFHSDKI
jgi:hypothetical protein